MQKKEVLRKWVTYNEENKKMYCSFCLMYADSKNINSPFIEGCSAWPYMQCRITEHENSKYHKISSEAYFRNKANKSIKQSMRHKQASLRQKQVLKRRAVLSCIIDALFYLAMQALPLRGHNKNLSEAFDENETKNTGNFMEIIKLLAEYVPILKEYIENI